MTPSDIAYPRLYNQRIVGPRCADPAEVVRWLGAMQAQDYHQALWAIGLRTLRSTVADVEQAIADRKILRTWPMRGTIHFVPSEDARWMLQLTASWMLARDGRRQEQLGLDEGVMERCKGLFYDALQGGRRLLRSEMLSVLEAAGISTSNQRGYHILWYVSQCGVICLGPMQDKQQTFVLLDEWAPHARALSREEALAELTTRYFASHGPATTHDFAWWTGLTVADAKAGLESARPGLISVAVNGKDYWMTPDALDRAAYTDPDIYLLPGFDEYLLGYKDRSAVLAAEHARRVVPGNNGVFLPVIVAGGRVMGTWKRTVKKRTVELMLSPFTALDAPHHKVADAANNYSAFLGLSLSVTTVSNH